MGVRITDIVIDCADPSAAAVFWCAALQYSVTAEDHTGVAISAGGPGPTLLFLASEDEKLHKNRMHLDICPTQGSTQADEVARLESLGARRVDVHQGDVSWVVMADPTGNEFCVMATVVPPEST